MWDRITATCALFVAFISLIVATCEMRENQLSRRLSVKPQLLLDVSANKTDGYVVRVLNRGLGPGKIKWFRVFTDDVEAASWDDVYTHFNLVNQRYEGLGLLYPENLISNLKAEGSVLVAEEDLTLAKALWDARDRTSMAVCYCSLYSECKIHWHATDENEALLSEQYSLECHDDMNFPMYFQLPPSLNKRS